MSRMIETTNPWEIFASWDFPSGSTPEQWATELIEDASKLGEFDKNYSAKGKFETPVKDYGKDTLVYFFRIFDEGAWQAEIILAQKALGVFHSIKFVSTNPGKFFVSSGSIGRVTETLTPEVVDSKLSNLFKAFDKGSINYIDSKISEGKDYVESPIGVVLYLCRFGASEKGNDNSLYERVGCTHISASGGEDDPHRWVSDRMLGASDDEGSEFAGILPNIHHTKKMEQRTLSDSWVKGIEEIRNPGDHGFLKGTLGMTGGISRRVTWFERTDSDLFCQYIRKISDN